MKTNEENKRLAQQYAYTTTKFFIGEVRPLLPTNLNNNEVEEFKKKINASLTYTFKEAMTEAKNKSLENPQAIKEAFRRNLAKKLTLSANVSQKQAESWINKSTEQFKKSFDESLKKTTESKTNTSSDTIFGLWALEKAVNILNSVTDSVDSVISSTTGKPSRKKQREEFAQIKKEAEKALEERKKLLQEFKEVTEKTTRAINEHAELKKEYTTLEENLLNLLGTVNKFREQKGLPAVAFPPTNKELAVDSSNKKIPQARTTKPATFLQPNLNNNTQGQKEKDQSPETRKPNSPPIGGV